MTRGSRYGDISPGCDDTFIRIGLPWRAGRSTRRRDRLAGERYHRPSKHSCRPGPVWVS